MGHDRGHRDGAAGLWLRVHAGQAILSTYLAQTFQELQRGARLRSLADREQHLIHDVWMWANLPHVPHKCARRIRVADRRILGHAHASHIHII